jgi:hypothetical protein
MFTRLNQPTLAFVFSLFAVCCALAAIIAGWQLPDAQSFRAFVIFVPLTILAAMLGYLLGATSKATRASIAGYLLGGSVLMAILVVLMWPVFG